MSLSPESKPLLEARQLTRRFSRRTGALQRLAGRLGLRPDTPVVHAVDGVDLTILRGEITGPGRRIGLREVDARAHAGRHRAALRRQHPRARGGRRRAARDGARRLATQLIFQDPLSSLNPRKRVRDIIGEAPLVHGLVDRAGQQAYVVEMMERVGLNPDFRDRFPHQFSGGQRQRIGIGRALAVDPDFLICDESIAALDVSIQAQIINLFLRLRDELGLTYLFISHDLGVVEHLSDRVAIMYLGRVVETAPSVELFARPLHPYTIALLGQVPRLSNRRQRFEAIRGEIPSPLAPPEGCHFHPRCPHANARCRSERPMLRETGAGHWSACHLVEAA